MYNNYYVFFLDHYANLLLMFKARLNSEQEKILQKEIDLYQYQIEKIHTRDVVSSCYTDPIDGDDHRSREDLDISIQIFDEDEYTEISTTSENELRNIEILSKSEVVDILTAPHNHRIEFSLGYEVLPMTELILEGYYQN